MVGRAGCVEAISSALDWVAAGRFGVVEVSGEAGIGKTRLLTEAGSLAGASGFLVGRGHATQFEQEVPLALFVNALRAIGFDVLTGTATQPGDRVRDYVRVRRRLMDSAGTGVALVLDDLHWADHPSLELTEYLIRNPPPAPVLLVLAFRSARTPVRIVDAITRAGPGTWRIHLDPLREADLRLLVPGVSRRRRGLLLRASHGNPLYLQMLTRLRDTALIELVRDGGDRGAVWADESTRQILHTLVADLAVLPDSCKRVAHAVAVIGDHATVDLVAQVAQLPAPAVADALDQLCGMGLGDMDGAWFRFHHPLIRAAAHDAAGPAWRTGAHTRAAEYLRAHDSPVPLIAHHVERSARYGDEAAAALLLDAGESVVYRAPGTAVRWLGTALRILAPTSRLLEARPAAVLHYARALGLAGELDRSWTVVQELLRDGHPLRAQAAAFGLVIARLRGDLDTASALLDAELLQARDPMVEGKLRIQLAALGSLREHAAAVRKHTRRALELLDGHRPALCAAARALQAWAEFSDGHADLARIRARQAAHLVSAVSDVTLRPHVELLGPLAWIQTRLGDFTSAGRHLERAYEVVDQAGQSSALPYLLVVDGMLQTRLGQLPAALDLLEQAGLAADQIGSAEIRAMADAVRILPLLWTAGPAAAIAVANRLDAAGRPRSRTWWRVGLVHLAVAHVAAGDPQRCLDLLTGERVRWPADPAATVIRLVLMAHALAGRGGVGAAGAVAQDAERIALSAGLDYEVGLAVHAQGYVATQAGRHDEAGALATRSAATFAVVSAPIEQARAHHLAAVAFARAGLAERSHEEFGRASSGYTSCAANWLLSTITSDRRRHAAQLSRRGRTPHRTDDVLTSRERQVADLVAAGLSNQEIAERLFVSHRTVESHLSRIFPKLDVRSRTALARRLNG
ncbi:MAG TPA: LuxR C-terminal-related transcriptional regulator [Actinophytocola sp.]|uniref:LuxR C-terminal-related transcriptional regulator n=1 Tax=Actinophytocola sp. TaxID=1872138 RepID=UPI002DBFD41E|nr:LuxR C-terminal-related transcriptional regulator [Actinophytocola sp.]HEU5472975.1 LuxR C-terminal-related transcriptional regulator [Actinophytocola sp.]